MRRELREGETLSIGATSENDIILDDDTISGRHAELEFHDGEYVLRDLDSENGTSVDGMRIEKQFVRPGQLIRIRDFELTIEDDKERKTVPAGDGERKTVPAGDNPSAGASVIEDENKTLPPDDGGTIVSGDRLVIVETPDRNRQGKEFGLVHGQECRIGREEKCSIRLTDPSVSKRHARIVDRKGRYVLVNWASSHGTFLNGEEVLDHKKLRYGDSIRVGNTTLNLKRDPIVKRKFRIPKWAIGVLAGAVVAICIFFLIIAPWITRTRVEKAREELSRRVEQAEQLYGKKSYGDAAQSYAEALTWFRGELPEEVRTRVADADDTEEDLKNRQGNALTMQQAASAGEDEDWFRVRSLLAEQDFEKYPEAEILYDSATERIDDEKVESMIGEGQRIVNAPRPRRAIVKTTHEELLDIGDLVPERLRGQYDQVVAALAKKFEDVSGDDDTVQDHVKDLEAAYRRLELATAEGLLEKLDAVDVGDYADKVEHLRKCVGYARDATSDEDGGNSEAACESWNKLKKTDPESEQAKQGIDRCCCDNDAAQEYLDEGMDLITWKEVGLSQEEARKRARNKLEAAIKRACEDAVGESIQEKSRQFMNDNGL